jgi:hypothetical protein
MTVTDVASATSLLGARTASSRSPRNPGGDGLHVRASGSGAAAADPMRSVEAGPALRPGRRVSVANERDVVRFGVLCSSIDSDGPWPTVLVALGGQLQQVDARDVEPWPSGPS